MNQTDKTVARPVRTFDTAAVYYHRFRLRHREVEYNFQDSAMAALFLACKVEDTIKKSKDILCAAYNLKNPDHQTTPDDKVRDIGFFHVFLAMTISILVVDVLT